MFFANFPNINEIIQKFNDTQCPNFKEGSAKNTHVSRSKNFQNNRAEIIPNLYNYNTQVEDISQYQDG